ncbi:class I SAM-dependent methyltransferase [Desulforamulus ruminis]|uniref:class I SAM-dependent methyltransferase n=1 Tax=Desulforamulus ruminis TaxID=1564 RepID=UPI002FDB2AC9
MLSYEDKLKNEICFYENAFKGRMGASAPEIWARVEEHFANAVEAVTGVRNLYQYVARHVQGKAAVSILGLGSGACGNELDGIAPLLKNQNCKVELTCVDINEKILQQAAEEAAKRQVDFQPLTSDINQIQLKPERYDVIVAYASLHHFVELDHIAGQVNKALRPDGIFVTVDIPTRNGYLMWDETYEVVNAIWKILPVRYKIDQNGYGKPTYLGVYPNTDYSEHRFECINSEAILPALKKHLVEVDYVPALSIARRFFDGKFGPNFDLSQPLDAAIFDFITRLDTHYIETGILKPETFFGAYGKKS